MSLQLTLGVGGLTGPLGKTATVQHLAGLSLFAEFRNPGKKPLAAVIHATPLANGEYAIEITDAEGKPVDVDRMGGCGTMSPLMDHEIFTVEPGMVIRTPVHLNFHFLRTPGIYRLRVRYRAWNDPATGRGAQPTAEKRLKQLWTGTLHSDWITFTVTPA